MTYGCRNRPPFVASMIVQDGYFIDGVQRIAKVKQIDSFSHGSTCKYQADDKYSDPQCVGCSHKAKNENAQMIPGRDHQYTGTRQARPARTAS